MLEQGLFNSPLILRFLCELLSYEDDSREADVGKEKSKITIGNLRLCLCMSGLIRLSSFPVEPVASWF